MDGGSIIGENAPPFRLLGLATRNVREDRGADEIDAVRLAPPFRPV
jgi:hypothetical protein